MEQGKATHSSIWPGEFHGLHSPRGRKQSDTTEWFFTFTLLRDTHVYSFLLGSALKLLAESPGAASPVACAVTGPPAGHIWPALPETESDGPRGTLAPDGCHLRSHSALRPWTLHHQLPSSAALPTPQSPRDVTESELQQWCASTTKMPCLPTQEESAHLTLMGMDVMWREHHA